MELERWGIILSAILKSKREHQGYWQLVSLGFIPEKMSKYTRRLYLGFGWTK